MATLEENNNYFLHYRHLKQAMVNDLIVKKVHIIMEFQKSLWLATYIDLNTGMRKKATNEFKKNEKDKLMNNAVFGKTMESMRWRIDMELVSNEKKVQKLISKTTFKHCTTYNENQCAVSLENKIIYFYKPIYIGFAVLDISKTEMYDYHYNVMKKHFKNLINLLYTDTDSLVYLIKTSDYYANLRNNPGLLECTDTANLPVDHPCYVIERKKKPGLFSDESDGRTITEFCTLRAKVYTYNIDGVEKTKAKGIRGHAVKNHMTFNDHKKCLFAPRQLKRPRVHIPSIQKEDGTWARSEQDKAEVYARHLERIFQSNDIVSELNCTQCQPLNSTREFRRHFTPLEVAYEIDTNINTKKPPGFNEISPQFVPEQWKRAEVIMLLKPGKPPEQAFSYRPIACMSKLFEKLFLKRLNSIIEAKQLIPDH
ncbi:DNA polymerase, palm domain [Cinara cedri]|uniref:DNA polymerase, palm domain n=1 Tax=Cinara cedri TaxID=506608 RepID=A0A5E4MRZ6_9HEMI|nr:DNA polymerase, palm domain [Cinara cedri]